MIKFYDSYNLKVIRVLRLEHMIRQKETQQYFNNFRVIITNSNLDKWKNKTNSFIFFMDLQDG